MSQQTWSPQVLKDFVDMYYPPPTPDELSLPTSTDSFLSFTHFINSHGVSTLCPHEVTGAVLAMTVARWSRLVPVSPSFLLCKTVPRIFNSQKSCGDQAGLSVGKL